jgi:hypothetical protein
MAMKKRVFIIYGWDGFPEECWFPWLKKELEKKGFEVSIPDMPNPEIPVIEDWVSAVEEAVGNADENTFFVGHSTGCQTIIRYLEGLPDKTKIGGVVFVAGWFKLTNLEDAEVEAIAEPWLTRHIDFSKVKMKIKNSVAILSDNDTYNYVKENSNIFKNKLGAKIVMEHNKGHIGNESGIKELPSALKEILRISKD